MNHYVNQVENLNNLNIIETFKINSKNEYHGWNDQWDREYDGRKPESTYSGYYEDDFVVDDDEYEESDYEPNDDEDVSECDSDSEY